MKVSEEVKFFEEAFDVLNQRYFESALSKIAITIQSTPQAHGHFTPFDSWIDGNVPLKEINLGAESLKRPVVEAIATLLHEMVHYYCFVNKIKDTSRGGTYHNKRFKEECEKRDLIISYHSRIGYSLTKPGPVLYDLVEEYGWKEKIRLFRTGKKISSSKGGDSESGHTGTDGSELNGKKKSSTRKYVCPKCRMSIRATKVVRVACIDCNNTQMVLG